MNPKRTQDSTPRSQTKGTSLRVAPALAIAAFTVAILYQLTILGRALYWGDLLLYFYPLEDFVRHELRTGMVPLWNPYVFCGQPLVGNPQSSVFYPTTLLLYVLPVWLFFTVNCMLHLAGAGWGTYLYLRRLSGDRTAAMLGAFTFCGSGFIVARLQFPTMLQSVAFLPWTLILVDRVIERPRIWYGALLGLVVSLLLLAAHAQIAYMTLACGIVYALMRLFQIRRHPARAWRALADLTGALALGVLGSSVQLLPTLQLFGKSTREQLRWREANRFVLLPEQLSNFVWPNYYGSPARGDYWGSGNAWEPCIYIGILPLLLAGFAIMRGARRPAVQFFTILGLISLLLAMGRYGGLYWLAYYLVPGIASFHDPARFAFLVTFAFAVLAAIGTSLLRDRGVSPAARTTLTALAALNILWFAGSFNPSVNSSDLIVSPRSPQNLPQQGDGRVYTSLRQDVWRRYVNYSDYGPSGGQYVRELTDSLSPNVGMQYGIEEASGYEPVPLREILEVDDLVQDSVIGQSPRLPALLGMMDVRTLILPHNTRYPHPDLGRRETRGLSGYSLIQDAPRAWLVRKTTRVDGGQRSLTAIASPEFDPRIEAIVSNSAGLPETPTPVDPIENGTVKITSQSPGLFAVYVDGGSARSFLVRSAAYYAGWRATVDGRPALVKRADHAFQGLALPPGAHSVVFRYRPFIFEFGLYATLLAGALMSAGFAFGMFVRPGMRNQVTDRGIQRPLAN